MSDVILDMTETRRRYQSAYALFVRGKGSRPVWWRDLVEPLAQSLAAHLAMDYEILGEPGYDDRKPLRLCLHSRGAAGPQPVSPVLSFTLRLVDAHAGRLEARCGLGAADLPDVISWEWLRHFAEDGEVSYE